MSEIAAINKAFNNEVENQEVEKKQSMSRRLWEWWKRVARKIGDFNARVILTLFYFLLLMPFALLLKLFTDPLEIKKNAHKGWHIKKEKEDMTPLERAERQS